MTTDTDDLRERAEDMDADWERKLNEATGDGGGCAEMFEALTEMREDDGES